MTATPRLNALGIVCTDLTRTVAFYRALGCDLPDVTAADSGAEAHLECDLGGVRLMFDTEEVMTSFSDDDWSDVGAGRVSLAAECDSPGEVDRLHDELAALGGGSHLAPFDAFWGQRYAGVLDPDGTHVHLYAALPTS